MLEILVRKLIDRKVFRNIGIDRDQAGAIQQQSAGEPSRQKKEYCYADFQCLIPCSNPMEASRPYAIKTCGGRTLLPGETGVRALNLEYSFQTCSLGRYEDACGGRDGNVQEGRW